MSHDRSARKARLSTCTVPAPWRRVAFGATMLATVASAAGVVAGLALGGARPAEPAPSACVAPDSQVTGAAARAAAPVAGGVAPASRVTERPAIVEPSGARHATGLPAHAGAAAGSPSARAAEPRRTRAQRLVSAQLDAMVARADQLVPDATDVDADADVTTEAFPGPANGELQQETARAVLAGMLEGFAGVPARAQGSPDAATEP